MMAIIDCHSKYVWDFYLRNKTEVFGIISEWLKREIKPMSSTRSQSFEMFLVSDLGEAHTHAIINECKSYNVTKLSVPGANTHNSMPYKNGGLEQFAQCLPVR